MIFYLSVLVRTSDGGQDKNRYFHFFEQRNSNLPFEQKVCEEDFFPFEEVFIIKDQNLVIAISLILING